MPASKYTVAIAALILFAGCGTVTDSTSPTVGNTTDWRNRAMNKFFLCLFAMLCLLPSYTKAQSTDSDAIPGKKGIVMVYMMYDASFTRFHTPLDGITKNYNSPWGITLGVGTAFDTFLNGVIQVSSNEIEEPVHPNLDLVSNTQIWEFMGGVKMQDPNQNIYWDLLAGLNRHIYNFDGVDLGAAGDRNSFAISTSMNIPFMRISDAPLIATFGVKKAFHEDIGHVNYSFGIKSSYTFE